MTRVGRRTFLKLSGGAAAAVTGTGGLAAILATGRAPAFAQQTTVHWLRWNDFVPASDQLLRKELLPEAEKALGIKVNFETVDVSDVAEEVSGKEGGLYKYSRSVTSDGKKFNAMPWTIVGAMNAYRKSWFDEVGVTKFPETWEAYLEAGKKLKAKGHSIGQAVSHSFGDPLTFVYPLLWSFG